jgi:hypothetical protein
MADMDKVSLNLRLPGDLHADLKRAAVQEERSLNTLIVRWLRESLARYQAESGNLDQNKELEAPAPLATAQGWQT